jgi:HAMP domain-containing protein
LDISIAPDGPKDGLLAGEPVAGRKPPITACATGWAAFDAAPFFSSKLLNSRISVRSRIVAIAVLPVIGFLANGIAFTAGQTDVEHALGSVKQATALAKASEGVKAGLAAMRIGIRDFIAGPNQDSIAAFNAGAKQAAQNLGTIEGAVSEAERSALSALNKSIAAAQANFLALKRERENLGLTEADGIRGRLDRAGAAIETIIRQDLTWVADEDARKLMISLLTMRRYEAEYRLTRGSAVRRQFFDEINALFDSVDGAPSMREQLINEVQAYADTFGQWVSGVEKVGSLTLSIDSSTQSVLPLADQILKDARDRAAAASAALSVSQARTKQIITWVGWVAAAMGLFFSVTRPLNGLADAMTRLAAGDTSARIPATHAKKELDGALSPDVPQHHAGARAAGGQSIRRQSGARAARRAHRRHHRPLREVGRQSARQGARRLAPPGGHRHPAQQRRRRGLHRGAHRRAAGRGRLRQRDRGRRLGRGAGRLDRRDRPAGHPLHRGRLARRQGRAPHRAHHV